MASGIADWAVTGHRPRRLGLGLGSTETRDREELVHFAIQQLLDHASNLDHRVLIYTGMAQGWDQAVAVAAMRLRIPFRAVVPCFDQHSLWPENEWPRYFGLLSRAEKVVYTSKATYRGPEDMMRRNAWLVDHCNHVLALWDGGPSGGTANCVAAAEAKGLDVVNTWTQWQGFRRQR